MPPDCPAAARRRHSKPRHPAERNGKKSNKRASVIHDISPPETAASFVPSRVFHTLSSWEEEEEEGCAVSSCCASSSSSLFSTGRLAFFFPPTTRGHVSRHVIRPVHIHRDHLFVSKKKKKKKKKLFALARVRQKRRSPHLDNTDTHTIRAGLSERERACTSMTHHLFRSCLGFQVAGREAALVGCQSADCRSILSHTSAYVRTTGLLMPLCRYRRRHPG